MSGTVGEPCRLAQIESMGRIILANIQVEMVKLLLLDDLHPGDVILTGSLSFTSLGIRAATFSRYSHAAIVIDPLIWFESISDGVRFRIPDASLVLIRGQLRCALRIPAGQNVGVIRAKSLMHHSDDQRASTCVSLVDFSHKLFHREYPRADGFLDVLKFRLGQMPFLQRLVARFKGKPTYFPGPFCSQLVVECLRAANVSLLCDLKSSAISPAALNRSRDFCSVNTIIWLPRGEPFDPRFCRLADALQFQQKSSTQLLDELYENEPLRRVVAALLHMHNQIDACLNPMPSKVARSGQEGGHLDFSRELPSVNPVNFYITAVVEWWIQYRAAQRCSKACQAADCNWDCAKLGCKQASNLYGKGPEEAPAAFGKLFDERDAVFQQFSDGLDPI